MAEPKTESAKLRLRQQMIGRRSKQSAREWKENSLRILKRYFQMPYYEQSDVVLAYLPARGEPDLSGLFKRCFEEGKPVAVPKVLTGIREGAGMEFIFLRPDSQTRENAFQIQEPEEGERFCDKEWRGKRIELILPGLCFDGGGGRLGYGGGYYDRYLASCCKEIHKTALAFAFQRVDTLPCEEHDISYDLLVTEKEAVFLSYFDEKTEKEKNQEKCIRKLI